ncbi:MAG: LPS export ABC transporter ATP-binding protein, partial [Legionella sp.]
MNTLKATNLKKSFKSRTVVNGVSMTINAGECVGLLGPNGAGKTTCFYMIVGLQNCDEGQITLKGQDITQDAMHKRARLGLSYLPQEASVFRKLTVAQNIMAILELRDDLNEQAREEKLDLLLQEFHITHIEHSLGMALSGGERRRVEIARALA